MGLMDKLFGTRSQREIKKLQPTVDKILSLEEEYKALSERKQAKYREKNRDFLEDYHYTLKYVQKHNGDNSRFLSLDTLKAKRDKLLSEKSAKNMEYGVYGIWCDNCNILLVITYLIFGNSE